MYAYVEKLKENKSGTVAKFVTQRKNYSNQEIGLMDNRVKYTIQRKRPYDSTHTNVMDSQNINYNKKDLLLTVENKYSIGPKYFFLESGSEKAGGWHAINRHFTQLMKPPYNIYSGDQLVEFLDNRLSGGDYSICPTSRGFEVKIEVDDSHFMRMQVGTNGFIVTVIPESEGTEAIIHPNTF